MNSDTTIFPIRFLHQSSVMARESADYTNASTYRAIANAEVRPGDSMPPRWTYAPSRKIRKSGGVSPTASIFGR